MCNEYIEYKPQEPWYEHNSYSSQNALCMEYGLFFNIFEK